MERRVSPAEPNASPDVAPVLERNIQALLTHRQGEQQSRGLGERIADGVTWFTGSIYFASAHVIILSLWILANLGWLPRMVRFDPAFSILASVASIEALFLAIFVLITQKRMGALDAKRAELDLQISLLSEHEITRLITLVAAMAERMGLEVAQDPELAELAQDVAPEEVMEKMEAHQEAAGHRGTPRGKL